MSAQPTGGADEPVTAAVEAETPTYQGSRFPWWLLLIWAAFGTFAVLYSLWHTIPSLKAWLAR